MLQTAQEEGLVVDLALGPNQGAGVPAPSESDGLLWDLFSFEVSVPIGGTFDGVLPGWNSGAFGGCVNRSGFECYCINDHAFSNLPQRYHKIGRWQRSRQNKLSFKPNRHRESLVRILSETCTLSRGASTGFRHGRCAPKSPIKIYEQNGSWVVDHFSALGAQTLIDLLVKSSAGFLDDKSHQESRQLCLGR